MEASEGNGGVRAHNEGLVVQVYRSPIPEGLGQV